MAEAIGQEDITVVPNIKCELCEEGDVNWKCLTCNEYLCHQCRRTHLKSKASCNHTVTSINGFENQQQYKREEKDDHYCTSHYKEVIIMYCEQCDLPICRDCISSGLHQPQKLTKIEDIIENKREELFQVTDEAGKSLSTLEDVLKSINQIRDDYSQGIEKRINEVKSRNAKLKATFDQIANNIIIKLKQEENQNQEILSSKEKKTESRRSALMELITRCKGKQVKRDKDLVRFVTDAKQELEKHQMCDLPDPLIPPAFVTKDVDIEELIFIFGDLDLDDEKGSDCVKSTTPCTSNIIKPPTIDVKIISTFAVQECNLVAAVSDSQAWVGNNDGTTLELYNKYQTVLPVMIAWMDIGLSDLDVTKSNELLVAGKTDQSYIKKITSDGTPNVTLYTCPENYNVTGITVTDTNSIVVCMFNSHIDEDQITQISQSGQVINTIYKQRNSEKIALYPYRRISSNRNGDIIVSRLGNRDVIDVFDKVGCKRFTYTGHVQGTKISFNPAYIVTDQYGHILISDCNNSVIHLLDKDGKFLQYIETKKHGLNPGGMSIDTSGRLWVISQGNEPTGLLSSKGRLTLLEITCTSNTS